MKKTILLATFATSVSLFTSPVFAASIDTNSTNPAVTHVKVINHVAKDVNALHSLGFTDQEIKDMTDDQYLKNFAGKKGKVVSQVTKYYQVSKDTKGSEKLTEVSEQVAKNEAAKANKIKHNPFQLSTLNKISPMTSTGGTNTASNSWMSQTTTVSVVGLKFFTKNSFTWLYDPAITLTDVVGIGHDSSTQVDTTYSSGLSYTFDVYYADGSGYDGTYTSSYTTANCKNSGGWAWEYDILGTYNSDLVENDRGYCFYYMNATPSNYVGQGDAYGNYAHQQATAGGSIGISFSGVSMSVTPSWTFDNAVNTQAQFHIN